MTQVGEDLDWWAVVLRRCLLGLRTIGLGRGVEDDTDTKLVGRAF